MPSVFYSVYNETRSILLADAVELAGHGSARRKGLLGRESLSVGGGLWIVPCEAVHTFGMRFAIDLLFLDRDHCVRKFRRVLPANRLSACLRAHSVLELRAGSLTDNIVEVGDQIRIQANGPSDQQA